MAKPSKSAKPPKPARSKPEPKLKKADKPAAKAVLGGAKGKKDAKPPKGHKKARKKVEATFELLDEMLSGLHKQLRKVWGKTAPDLTVLTADDRATLGLSGADVASLEQMLAVLLHKKGEGFLDAMFSLPGASDEGVSSDDGENDGDDLALLGALADDGDE
jgi:hypothetical protein